MKTTTQKPTPETTLVPVVTLEEVPVLSDMERRELFDSLTEAEADIAAGRTAPYERESFTRWFLGICRGEID